MSRWSSVSQGLTIVAVVGLTTLSGCADRQQTNVTAAGAVGTAHGAAVNVATDGDGKTESEMRVPVTFSGGHEIGDNDFGRPVVLMAAALGVEPDVFRQAFSGVTPARGRGPTGEEQRKNKGALMKVLGPHGVTNERMDEVANYYRFRPQDGELWPTTEAKAYAVVKDGQIVRIVVDEPGSGCCSPPRMTVKGFPKVELKATLGFSKNFKKNGTIASIDVAAAATPATSPSRDRGR
jgi:hypothetical protein